MESLEEAESMTFYEYDLRMTAANLREVDNTRRLFEGAFANRAAKATDKAGKKYKYRDVKQAYNYEKEERKILSYETDDQPPVSLEQLKAVARFNQRGGA